MRAFGPDFYDALDRDFAGFAGCALVSRYSFSEPWPTWEMHPEGDEFVTLLEGGADFVFWRDGAEEIVAVAQPGQFVVVPRGVWHTARPHRPTTMLFVTPGEGTQNRAAPPDRV